MSVKAAINSKKAAEDSEARPGCFGTTVVEAQNQHGEPRRVCKPAINKGQQRIRKLCSDVPGIHPYPWSLIDDVVHNVSGNN